METNGIFKKLDVCGVTKEEALAKAPFAAKFDATNAYKTWKSKQKEGITEAAKKQFMVNYLATKTKNIPGAGCYIVEEAAVADTRERPYKYENLKREGATTVRTTYVWLDDETGDEVCKVVSTAKHRATKNDAAKAIKEVMANGDYKGNAHLYVRKEEAKPVALASCKYTPSKGSHPGSYVAFGIVAE